MKRRWIPPQVPSAAAEAENVVPFPRRGRRLRRSRRSALVKWGKPFLSAVVIVGLPAAAVAWPLTSPRFALRALTVETGGQRVDERWVRRALDPLLGQNLPLLSLAHAERLLGHHPWIGGVDLRKQLPDRLAVRVSEKRAVALLRGEGGLSYVAGDGTPIAPFDPFAGGADLLLLSLHQPHCSPLAGLEMAREIEAVSPSWSAGLSEIEVLGESDFRIHTASLPFPLLVRAGTLAQKNRRLEALLPRIVESYDAVAAVDLRFARRIIVQPPSAAAGRPARARGARTGTREATADVQRG